MLFKVFVVCLREVASIMDAPAFAAFFGGLSHYECDSEHILAFPSLRRVEDFVHNVSLPESDNFLGFCERLSFSCDADISPHKRAERISHITGVKASSV